MDHPQLVARCSGTGRGGRVHRAGHAALDGGVQGRDETAQPRQLDAVQGQAGRQRHASSSTPRRGDHAARTRSQPPCLTALSTADLAKRFQTKIKHIRISICIDRTCAQTKVNINIYMEYDFHSHNIIQVVPILSSCSSR